MTGPWPPARPLGDAAVLADLDGDVEGAQRLARLVGGARDDGSFSWVEEVVIGFGTVTVIAKSAPADLEAHCGDVSRLAAAAAAGQGAAPCSGPGGESEVFEIPVRFDGPDLDEMSRALRRPGAQVVAELAGCDLRVAFVGFSPGFAYLVGLPSDLAAVPRRQRPRPAVPAGSLAIGGGFAAVYPQATPGGWNLVGRTDSVLFDAEHPPYCLLSPGQRVRLSPIQEEPGAAPSRPRLPLRAGGAPSLVVESPGLCSLVEDEGRRAVAALGVPRAGAADSLALRLVNRLVGNPDNAAALEVTVSGPRLRATAELHFAVLGHPERPGLVDVRVEGRGVPEGEVVPLSAGQLLEVGNVGRPARALVALSGGLETPKVLGSRSSDLLCGLGPGPLRPGDELAAGRRGRPRARLRFRSSAGPSPGDGPTTLRVLPGPDVAPWRLPADAAARTAAALAGEWRVDPQSNRVGLRLAGAGEEPVGRAGGSPSMAAVPSRGMVAGAVQRPPGGELVVLGPDHATVGGYPVVAVVCSADLFRLAHLPPGSAVRFEVVDQAEAVAALARQEASVGGAVEGWYPTRAG